MRTFQSQSQPAQRGASSSRHSLSSSAMIPVSTASVTFAALLILTIPVCRSKLDELSYFKAVCSCYLSTDLKASDILGELCVLMLVQKSKVPHTPLSHHLLHLVSYLHNRGKGGLSVNAVLQGPGGIQSRGYFLYRPRNGRRSLEYE
uniref:Neuromedin U C-terminal domain-containing protein n=1 Tax=Monopterus albus TaxID=43700 RepID=A0A3Q3JMK6_MONAL